FPGHRVVLVVAGEKLSFRLQCRSSPHKGQQAENEQESKKLCGRNCFHFISSLQVLAEFSRRHAGVMPEKMAEIKFAGEIELRGDVLDGKPFVSEKQSRLIQPRTLDMLVNRALAGRVKKRPQAGVTDFCDGSEFERFPVARRVRGNGVEHTHDG